jgi:hypothetical protein
MVRCGGVYLSRHWHLFWSWASNVVIMTLTKCGYNDTHEMNPEGPLTEEHHVKFCYELGNTFLCSFRMWMVGSHYLLRNKSPVLLMWS